MKNTNKSDYIQIKENGEYINIIIDGKPLVNVKRDEELLFGLKNVAFDTGYAEIQTDTDEKLSIEAIGELINFMYGKEMVPISRFEFLSMCADICQICIKQKDRTHLLNDFINEMWSYMKKKEEV